LRRSIACAALSISVTCSNAAELAQNAPMCTAEPFRSFETSSLHVDSVSHVQATALVPAHCAVLGHIDHGTRVGFKLGLPEQWNGKYLFQGIGGFAGTLDPIEPGLARGYATGTGDTGHQGSSVQDATWALNNPAAVVNHFEGGTAVAASTLKELVAAYYRAVPRHAYFQGCSAGGRQGIVEAERFPGTFDGIIAGAPAWNYSRLLTTFIENGNAILQSPANWISPELFQKVDQIVLEQCDANDGDGLRDGIITDPLRCEADLAVLLCRNGMKPGTCLTPAQLAMLRKLTRADFARGEPGYFGYPLSGSDRDVGFSWGWPKWFFGTLPPTLDKQGKLNFRGAVLPEGPDRGFGPNQFLLGEQFFRYMVNNDPAFDARSFSWPRDVAPLQARLGGLLDADQTDVGPFIRGGGRLLIWHGWSDPAIPGQMSIDLYERMKRATRQYAGQTPTHQAVRLFMVPGVQHCGGGAGLNGFDPLTALEKWVEEGAAPEHITASQLVDGKVARSRPVCAYPKVARYRGSGNPDEEGSFECR
jgi:feruloyl esterase